MAGLNFINFVSNKISKQIGIQKTWSFWTEFIHPCLQIDTNFNELHYIL